MNLSSIHGMAGFANYSAYGSSKWATRGLTKIAALELAPRGVRVNAVMPGPVETSMTELPITHEEAAALWSKVVPMGRIGQPDDIAFLVSDDSAFCAGAELVVDGARSVGYSTPADVKR